MGVRGVALLAAVLASLVSVVWSDRACAQGYYNLDAGRPSRMEDASPTPRSEIELQLLPLRFEQFASGARRWRTDSKIAFGVAPFTEIELRAPFVVIDPRAPGGRTRSGFGGLAVGALHALTLETGALPAVAVAGEISLPVGTLAARIGSYSMKLLGTKSLSFARLHANVGYGTWSIRTAPNGAVPCPNFLAPGEVLPPGCVFVQQFVPDTPCDRINVGPQLACIANTSSVSPVTRAVEPSSIVASAQRAVGSRWMAGVGADHSFALSSTLFVADVFAERFIGLYDGLDWSGEVGMRYQWTPQLVLDAGLARHFSGIVRSNAVTLGATYGVPVQGLDRRRRE